MNMSGGSRLTAEARARAKRRKRWGCLALAVVLTPVVAYLVFGILLAFSFRECFPIRTVDGVSTESTATLDVATPAFEQRVTVHIPAAGLPDGTRAGAVTLNLDPVIPLPVAAPRGSAGSSPASAAPSLASPDGTPDLRIAFIRDDTGEVVARVAPPV